MILRIVLGVALGLLLMVNGLVVSYDLLNVREEIRLRQEWHDRVTALCAPRQRYQWPERAIRASLKGMNYLGRETWQ
jgi:hypothetical protein